MRVRREKQLWRKITVTFGPQEKDKWLDEYAGHCQLIHIEPLPRLKPHGTRRAYMWEPVN
jgi:hypothetical protein